MGYLTDKRTVEVYRSIRRIGFNPATGELELLISEGVDVPDPHGALQFVATAPDYSPNLAGSGQLLTAPLAALLPTLGLKDAGELAAISTKELIVRLVNAALEPPAG